MSTMRRRARSALAPAARRVNSVLTTVGVRTKGFFTPYDHLASTGDGRAPYEDVARLFEARRGEFAAFVAAMGEHNGRFAAFGEGEIRPSWTSSFVPPLDGAAMYTAVARHRPARILEVGCGTSTHFLTRAVADEGLDCRVTCIDPAPRREIEHLPVHLERRVLRVGDVSLAREMAPGDVFFVDSSHIAQPGFDVDIILNRMLPALPSGAIVHLHDIFLPYHYPPHWNAFRFNEQTALVGWLISGYLELIFAAHFALRDMQDDLAGALPDLARDRGGSIWLRKA